MDYQQEMLERLYVAWDRWPQAKFLGLTATPCRLNNDGFPDRR